MNIFANFQIGYCYDTCERSSVFIGEIIADTPPRTAKINMANSWTSCSLRVRTHEMTPRSAALWLGRKTQKFSGTNQRPERPLPFGTFLVRHCPQGLFTPFFTFLRAIFFRPFSLTLAPTICPLVSEDAGYPTLKRLHGKLWSWRGGLPILADRATHLGGSLHLSWTLVSSGNFFLLDTDGSFISH